jgi:hypothetical protein
MRSHLYRTYDAVALDALGMLNLPWFLFLVLGRGVLSVVIVSLDTAIPYPHLWKAFLAFAAAFVFFWPLKVRCVIGHREFGDHTSASALAENFSNFPPFTFILGLRSGVLSAAIASLGTIVLHPYLWETSLFTHALSFFYGRSWRGPTWDGRT